jgi:hypothetical protein
MAAQVQETAESAKSMTEMAGRLEMLVRRFQIADTGVEPMAGWAMPTADHGPSASAQAARIRATRAA